MFTKLKLLFICFCVASACTHAPEPEENTGHSLPFSEFSLSNLDDFRQMEGSNWQIAGDVYANRKEEHHLQASKGTGILVNQPDDQSKDNLFTKLEHGDIDLELDFLMPKGSNSGIYLQGRYEVQLLDSWQTDSITYGDCGGIYQRWRNDQGFEGKAPSQNASKAPGLWQHMKIRFKAPEFDDSGKKTADARFEEVVLNGQVIQQQVAVSGPTQSAAFEDEKPQGPLMLQGDHGPIAFKNIQYKAYGEDELGLQDVQYSVYQGIFTNPDTLTSLEPLQKGQSDSLTYLMSKENDKYTLVFEGAFVAPLDGDYLFTLQSGGPSWLQIDTKALTDNDASNNYGHTGYGTIHLDKGEHTFQLAYVNLVPWNKSLSLHYEGPGIPFTELTTQASGLKQEDTEPLVIRVEDQPVLQRGFIYHKDTKETHAASVGMPGGLNYAYDLKNYNLLSTWHGGFLDVTEMWEGRGERQLEKPLGAPLELSTRPAVALLSSQSSSWPDSVMADENMFTRRGYKLRQNGLPVFFYTLENVGVEDYLHPSEDKKGLTREVSFHFNQAEDKVYLLLASGSMIEQLPDGSYSINGKSYYIDDVEGGNNSPAIRNDGEQYELLLPVTAQDNQSLVKYSIIW